MTTILVDLRRPDPTGVDAPVDTTLTWAPTRRHATTDYVVLPAGFTVRTADGAVMVDVAPTTPEWCWRVTEHHKAGMTRLVAVPDTTAVVNYVDLPNVDRATMEPSEDTVPAWEAATSATIVAANALQASVDNLNLGPSTYDFAAQLAGGVNYGEPSTWDFAAQFLEGTTTNG